MPTHINTTYPRARKVYACDLCSGDIDRGVRHVASVFVLDGCIYTFRTHFGCHALAKAAQEDGWERGDDGWTQWQFDELIGELGADNRFLLRILDDWFDALTKEEQARLFEMILIAAPEAEAA
jgi:hypothetical protein